MPSRLSYVWLSLKRGLGSRTAAEVLDAFGSPEAVFAADRQALTAAPCELRKTHVDRCATRIRPKQSRSSGPAQKRISRSLPSVTALTRTACGRSRIRRPCCMCADAGRISTAFPP